MSAQNERTSAKIYQFPARGRFARPGDIDFVDTSFPTVEIGTAWYHDEAVKEEQRKKVRKY